MSTSSYNTENYAKLSENRCKVIGYLVERHGNKLIWRGNECVLDIGCGIGDVSHKCFFPLLPHNYQKFVLADVAPNMLDVARKEFDGVEHVDFLLMDITGELESSLSGSFDKIFSSLCINHVKNQRKAFENIYELLAPGGECFLIIMVTAVFFETIFQLAESEKWAEKLKYHRDTFIFPYREDPDPEKTVTKLLKSTGFSDIFAKKEDLENFYPTANNFRESLRCLRDFANTMSQEEKDELLEDQVKLGIHFNIINEFYDPKRPILQKSFKMLTVHARKPYV